jgi:hypothetical protein
MNTQTRRIDAPTNYFLALLLLSAAATSLAADDQPLRSNSISQGQGIVRGGVGEGNISYQDLDALTLSGERQAPPRRSSARDTLAKNTSANNKSLNRPTATANVDFWFFDADLILFSDFDQDGYFYGLDLAFDVDTVFDSAEVYAVIYLSYEGGPWNEYVETENFNIFGASADDEYVVVSELVTGYPTGNYDVLIELYDTYDGAFVAEFGPVDTPQLSLLPLEDIGRDSPSTTVVVVTSEGGGSIEWWTLLSLLGVYVLRRGRVRR